MKILSLNTLGILVGGVVLITGQLGFISNAHAGYILGSCSLSDVKAEGSNASACRNYAGNDKNYSFGGGAAGYENYIAADFAKPGTNWSFLGADNESGDGVTGNGGAQSGTWAVNPDIDSLFVVTVKASNFFAAYLFENLSDISGGTYNVIGATTKTIGNPPRIVPGAAGRSGISVYVSRQNDIPEPATLGLFGLGLLGLGIAARQRRNAAA